LKQASQHWNGEQAGSVKILLSNLGHEKKDDDRHIHTDAILSPCLRQLLSDRIGLVRLVGNGQRTSLGFRVQGTGGLWMDVNKSIYIEGRSAEEDKWEAAQSWLDKYDHPLWRKYGAQAEGAGHGGMDFFVLHAFIEALKASAPMPIDIYDAVTWSAITPLS